MRQYKSNICLLSFPLILVRLDAFTFSAEEMFSDILRIVAVPGYCHVLFSLFHVLNLVSQILTMIPNDLRLSS
jgi:hypothetical protein